MKLRTSAILVSLVVFSIFISGCIGEDDDYLTVDELVSNYTQYVNQTVEVKGTVGPSFGMVDCMCFDLKGESETIWVWYEDSREGLEQISIEDIVVVRGIVRYDTIPVGEEEMGEVEIDMEWVRKLEDITTQPHLEFSSGPCDIGTDPWNTSAMGVQETTWIDDTTLEVKAYVSLNCAEGAESGDFEINGNTITLRYLAPRCDICAACNCVGELVYRFTNLERKEYTFELERVY